MRKLTKHEEKIIKRIIHENNAVFEMDNKRYYVSLMNVPEKRTDDNNTDIKTKQNINRLRKDIYNGKNFVIDDVVEMIDRGEL